jgi:hypothetical protein
MVRLSVKGARSEASTNQGVALAADRCRSLLGTKLKGILLRLNNVDAPSTSGDHHRMDRAAFPHTASVVRDH